MIPAERIGQSMLSNRGQKAMLDADSARLYGVETRALVRAATRNVERFPADFMSQSMVEDFANFRCQFGASIPM